MLRKRGAGGASPAPTDASRGLFARALRLHVDLRLGGATYLRARYGFMLISGQRAKMEVVRPPREVNSQRRALPVHWVRGDERGDGGRSNGGEVQDDSELPPFRMLTLLRTAPVNRDGPMFRPTDYMFRWTRSGMCLVLMVNSYVRNPDRPQTALSHNRTRSGS